MLDDMVNKMVWREDDAFKTSEQAIQIISKKAGGSLSTKLISNS